MSRSKKTPGYVAVSEQGPRGPVFRFPDLPGFFLDVDAVLRGYDGYIEGLERLEAHLADLTARGLAVPAPTPVRDIMTDPANRWIHHIFHLGELREHRERLATLRAIDEEDARAIRRYIYYWDGNDELAGELEFEPQPGLSRLQAIFGLSLVDPLLYNCYPIGPREAELLRPYLKSELRLDLYEYTLEAEGKEDEASTQVT